MTFTAVSFPIHMTSWWKPEHFTVVLMTPSWTWPLMTLFMLLIETLLLLFGQVFFPLELYGHVFSTQFLVISLSILAIMGMKFFCDHQVNIDFATKCLTAQLLCYHCIVHVTLLLLPIQRHCVATVGPIIFTWCSVGHANGSFTWPSYPSRPSNWFSHPG